ncbi:MAG: hypothetical protein HQ538_03520 [Parcubacteria group bacterium]|nr:hypothetical protein [Parcubacteria group bacterium]
MPEKTYLTEKPPKKFDEDENYVEIKPEEVLMEWSAPEFVQYSKPKSWYISLLIIAIALIVCSIITSNFLLTIIVIFLAIIVNSLTRKKPKQLDVAITKKGVKVNEKLYTFTDDLGSFWILYDPPDLKILNFKRQQRFLPEISIQLEKQNPLKIREFLLEYLEEEMEKEEHMADRVSRRIGF